MAFDKSNKFIKYVRFTGETLILSSFEAMLSKAKY